MRILRSCTYRFSWYPLPAKTTFPAGINSTVTDHIRTRQSKVSKLNGTFICINCAPYLGIPQIQSGTDLFNFPYGLHQEVAYRQPGFCKQNRHASRLVIAHICPADFYTQSISCIAVDHGTQQAISSKKPSVPAGAQVIGNKIRTRKKLLPVYPIHRLTCSMLALAGKGNRKDNQCY
ncbi:hypothetical protein D3C86_1308410 [compost metagenome]